MRRSTRDADYRGQKTSVDWSKLVYQVRRRRPGALEVLQDAILTYFPKQFGKAQTDARRRLRQGVDGSLSTFRSRLRRVRGEKSYEVPIEPVVYVVFSGRVARRRFEARKRRHSISVMGKRTSVANLPNPRSTPFSIMTHVFYLEDKRHPEFIAENAVVWSTKHGLRVGDLR